MRWLSLALLVACGGDDAPPPPPAGAAAPAAAKPADKDKGKDKLQPRMHAEDRVMCPVPEKPTGPACTVEAPTCEPGLYCLPTTQGLHCEPCTERDTIRHEFKDRDFVADGTVDHARDPFQSFVILQPDLGKPTEGDKHNEVGPCTRADQFVAPNYSVRELRLVGLVTQGTQRKALMMAGNKGEIIKRADCVGKEKAVVKEIGTGYIAFLINPETADKGPKRPAEPYEVKLYPNGLQLNLDQPFEVPPQPVGPAIAPPTVAPPASAPGAPNPVAPPPAQKP